MNERSSILEASDNTQLDMPSEHAVGEITEVEGDLLEQVAGGGGGTATGYG